MKRLGTLRMLLAEQNVLMRVMFPISPNTPITPYTDAMATPETDIVSTELWAAVTLRDAFGYSCSISLSAPHQATAQTIFFSKYMLRDEADMSHGLTERRVEVIVMYPTSQLCVWVWGAGIRAATQCAQLHTTSRIINTWDYGVEFMRGNKQMNKHT